MSMTNKRLIPPDGGWGWMVVLGVSSINLFTRAIEPSFGLLFGDVLNDLGVETTGAAVIMSTLEALLNFSGIFVGPLIKTFSYRKVSIVGSILVAIGLIGTRWANSLTHILITYSIINGLGVGLSTAAGFVGLNNFFIKNRGKAVGFSAAGVAFGMMVMPQAVGYMLNKYGFEGTITILGGLSLNALVASLLLQPVQWHYIVEEKPVEDGKPEEETFLKEKQDDEQEDEQLELKETKAEILNNTIRQNPAAPQRNLSTSTFLDNQGRKRKVSIVSSYSRMDFTGSSIQLDVDHEDYLHKPDSTHRGRRKQPANVHFSFESENQQESHEEQLKQHKTFWQKVVEVMDFDLFKDVTYLNLNFGLSMFYIAEQNFKVVIPFFFNSLGYEKSQVAIFLTIQSFADMIARLTLPTFCDKLKYSKRNMLMSGIIFLGFSRSVLAQQTNFVCLIVALVIAGFFRGASFINYTISISEFASMEKLPAALGLHNVTKGIFVVIIGPLLGKIRDLTQSYPVAIHCQTFLIMTCIFAWSIEYYIKYLKRKKKLEKIRQ